MNELPRNILRCIGNTSLLALRNIVPKNGSRILLKLESENPTGSMKDLVTSDAFSKEKLDHMKILGARLQIVHSESGGMTEKLTRDMIEAARVITEKTGGFC